MKLKNKAAIITGGSSGIGKSISALFSAEGAKVIIAGIDLEKGKRTAEQIKEAIFVRTDITKFSEVKNLVKKVIKKYGKIDILVNNAGYIKPSSFERINEEIWQKTIDVNLKGTYYLIKEVIPYMKKQRCGKIINISSFAGIVGSLVSVPYAVAKAGVIVLTRTLAKEYGKYNICINSVAPGPTKTEMIKKIRSELIKKVISEIPLRRLANPKDIAKVILFFASSDSDYVNGQTLIVDGGRI